MITREQYIEAARAYLGVRYRNRGRSKKTGVDCAGLIVCAAYDLGYFLEIPQDYEPVPKPAILIDALNQHAIQHQTIDLTPGNIALMEFTQWAGATHTAILTDIGILHAYANRKKVIEHRLNDVWKKKIKATFTLRFIDG